LKIDASNSIDEGLILINQKEDPLLLFYWDCPEKLKTLCKGFSTPDSNNKILEIKFSEYSSIINPPGDVENLDFILNLTKDKRSATKKITLKLRKPISTAITSKIPSKSNNITAISSLYEPEKKSEIDLFDLIVIEQNPIGNTDLLFEVSLLDPSINLDSYKYTWNIPHFTSENQYLNGVNEIKLRVKLSDLLIGLNKIIINIINPKTGKNYSKSYDYEKGLRPYGGDCRIEPFDGYSLQTNFNFTIQNWISKSKTLIYKIKFENKNKILFDLSNGGFSKNTFSIENLPVVRKLYLEVIDMQGFSTIMPCQVNVKINKNLPSLDSLLENVLDISKKLLIMEIYQSNINSDEVVSDRILDNSINMLDNYFDELKLENFLIDYEKIITTLITLSNQKLTNENITKLFKILNFIMKFIDPLLNDLSKVEYLFKILDNMNKKAGDQLQSIIIVKIFFKKFFFKRAFYFNVD